RTPPPSRDDNVTEQTIRASVGMDGSLYGERIVTYSALAAWPKRDDYVDTPKGECRRLAAAEIVDAFPKAKLHELTLDDSLEEFDRPLAVRTTFSVPDQFRGEKIRDGSVSDNALWDRLLSLTVNP